jgi:hypothetical protein
MTGYTHEEMGAALAQKWRFPPELVTAIERHHDTRLTVDEDGLCGIIANCDRLVTRLGIVSGFGSGQLGDETESDLQHVTALAGGTTAIMNRAAILMNDFLDRPGHGAHMGR